MSVTVKVTVFVPVVAYVWVVVMPLPDMLSPKFHWKFRPVPVDADASNWKFVLIVPDDGFTLKLAVGPAVVPTTMTVDADPDAPLLSVAVAVTCFAPDVVYRSSRQTRKYGTCRANRGWRGLGLLRVEW